MVTVLLQSAVLLILGQLLLGAVGYAVPQGLPWLGLPLGILLFWLILRVGRVLRDYLEAAARKRQPVAPLQMALWATLLWQLPSVILLPAGTIAPNWLGQIWNGVMLPVQGTAGLLFGGAEALASWLWVAVVVEALVFAFIVGRPLTGPAVAEPPALKQVAAAGNWAPARRHRDVVKKYNMPRSKG